MNRSVLLLLFAAAAVAQPSLLDVGYQSPAQLAPATPVSFASSSHSESVGGFTLTLEATLGAGDASRVNARVTVPADRSKDVQGVSYVMGRSAAGERVRGPVLGGTTKQASDFPQVQGSGAGWGAQLRGQPGDEVEAHVRLRRTPYGFESWPIINWFSPGNEETVVVPATVPGPRRSGVIRGLDVLVRYTPAVHAPGARNGVDKQVMIAYHGFETTLAGDPAMLARVRAVTVKLRTSDGWMQIGRRTASGPVVAGDQSRSIDMAHFYVRDANGTLRASVQFDPRYADQSPLKLDIELEGLDPVKDFPVLVGYATGTSYGSAGKTN